MRLNDFHFRTMWSFYMSHKCRCTMLNKLHPLLHIPAVLMHLGQLHWLLYSHTCALPSSFFWAIFFTAIAWILACAVSAILQSQFHSVDGLNSFSLFSTQADHYYGVGKHKCAKGCKICSYSWSALAIASAFIVPGCVAGGIVLWLRYYNNWITWLISLVILTMLKLWSACTYFCVHASLW